MKFRIPAIVALWLFVLGVPSAMAQGSFVWNGMVSNLWDDPGNWTVTGAPLGVVPTLLDDASFDPALGPIVNQPSTNTAAPVQAVGCRNLLVASGVTLTIVSAVPLNVAGNLSISGTTAGSGELRLVGGGIQNVQAPGGSCHMVGMQQPTAQAQILGVVNVVENFRLVSGRLVFPNPASRLSVGGVATFQGGEVDGTHQGTMDLHDVLWQGSLLLAPPATIECSGNWSASSVFSPTTDVVVFDGGVQAVAGLSGGGGRFNAVTVSTGASVNFGVAPNFAGLLTIQGNAGFNLGPVTLGAGLQTTASGIAFAAGVTFVLVGSGTLVAPPGTLLPSVTVAAPGGTVSINSALTIGGDLLVTSGTLSLGVGTTVVNGLLTVGATLVAPTLSLVQVVGAATIGGTATFASLTTQSSLSVAGSATINGTLDANGSVSLVTGGTLTLSAAAHSFAAGLGVASGGTLSSAGAVLRFDGTGSIVVPTGFGMPSVVVDSGPGIVTTTSTFTIAGTFTQISGTFSRQAGVVSVTGQAFFQGGTYVGAASPSGKLDVAGDVSFSNTVSTSTGTIECGGGLWFADTAFNPTSGEVVFDGTTQTLTGAGNFLNLRIAPPSLTTVPVAVGQLDVGGSLLVEGTLTLASASTTLLTNQPSSITGLLIIAGNYTSSQALTLQGSLTVNGVLTVAGLLTLGSAATLTLGSTGPHQLGGGVVVSTDDQPTSPISGPPGTLVRLVAPGGPLQIPSSTSLAVAIEIGPGATIVAAGTLRLDRDLIVDGGTLVLQSGMSIDAAEDLVLRSGSITTLGGTSASVDVAGNVLVSGGAVNAASTVFSVGGNFITTVANSPTWGHVHLIGATAQFVGGDPLRAASVTIGAGANVTSTADMVAAGTVVIGAGAVLTAQGILRGGALDLGVGGTLHAQSAIFTGVPGSVDLRGAATIQSSLEGVDVRLYVGATLSLGPTAVLISRGHLRLDTSFSGGRLRLAGAGTLTLAGGVSLPSTEIDGYGSTVFPSSVTVNGEFRVRSGFVALLNGATVTVTGAAIFEGGTLVDVTGGGTFDLNGSTTFSGTTVPVNAPQFRCSGSWTSNAAFRPRDDRVVFDGVGAQSVSVSGGNFFDLQIAAGANVVVTGLLSVDYDLQILGTMAADSSVQVTRNVSVPAGSFLSVVGHLGVVGNATISGNLTTTSMTTGGNLVLSTPLSVTSFATAGSMSLTAPLVVAAGETVATGTIAIGAGGSLTHAGSLRVGALTVAAASVGLNLASPAAELVASGNVEILGPAVLGAGVRMLGNGILRSNTAIPRLTIEGGATVTLRGAVTIAGALTQNSGQLIAESSSVVQIGGAATLEGVNFFAGSNTTFRVAGHTNLIDSFLLALGNPSIMDLDGDVTLVRTRGQSPPSEIRCAGNWIADDAFEPLAGTVVWDGPGISTASSSAPSGLLSFWALRVADGTAQISGDLTLRASSVTVSAGGALETSAYRLGTRANTVSVQGRVSVGAGGTWALGSGTLATVTPTGRLEVVGNAGSMASVLADGPVALGFQLVVQGQLAARHFLFSGMASSGVQISASATIDPAPHDLRDGTFVLSSITPGSVGLDLVRSVSTTFQNIGFTASSPVVGSHFNVRVLSGASVTFNNWIGDFGGRTFEDDPGGRIDWTMVFTQPATLSATPGPGRLHLTWSAPPGSGVVDHVLERQDAAGWSILEIASAGAPMPRDYDDLFLVPGETYTYRISARDALGLRTPLAMARAVPLPTAGPTSVIRVGAQGGPTALQDAIDAVTAPGTTVVVESGQWRSFRIDGAVLPSGLRIVAPRNTVSVIDVSRAPVEITGLPAASSLVIEGLRLDDHGGGRPALVVSDCAGTIVIDRLVTAVTGPDAVMVDNAGGVMMQDIIVTGDSALRVAGASSVVVLTSVLGKALVLGGTVEFGATPVALEVASGATVIQRPGTVVLVCPTFVAAGTPMHVSVRGSVDSTCFVGVATDLGWSTNATLNQEFPLLLPITSALPFAWGVIPPSGVLGSTFPPTLTGEPSLVGRTFHLQSATVDVLGSVRLSNLCTTSIIP